MSVRVLRSRRVPVAVLMAGVVAALVFGVFSAQASKVVYGAAQGSPFCSAGTGAGQCETPLGVAVNTTGKGGVAAGDVYVVDSGNNRIDQFTAAGVFVQAFGWKVGPAGENVCTSISTCKAGEASAAAGGMSDPQGVAVDQRNGNLYVTDQTNHRVDVFSAKGVFEGAFGWGVTNGLSELQFCTTSCEAGLAGAGAGEFGAGTTYPIGYPAVGPEGEVYVSDPTDLRFDEFSATLSSEVVTGVSFVRMIGGGVVSSGPDIAATSLTATTSSGSATLTGVMSASGVVTVGATLSGSGIPSGTTVLSVNRGAGTLVMSATATATASGVTVTATAGLEECNPTAGDVCKIGVAGSGLGQFRAGNPTRLAVDSTNSIYVLNKTPATCGPITGTAPCRVVKLNATATSASEFVPGELTETSGAPASVAVTDIAINAENNNVLVVKPTSTASEREVLEFNSSGSLLETYGVNGELPAASGLAVGVSERLYFSSSTGNEVYILGPIPGPDVTISQPNPVGTTTATLNGSINPEGFPTYYHFEYSTNGATWQSTAEVLLRSEGAAAEAVHQEVSGLTPDSVYLVRLVANNGVKVTSSTEILFTQALPPQISQTLASPVNATSADLTAYIAPYNSATTYYFEYGTTSTYGSRVPGFDRSIGAGAAPVPEQERISGLQPSTEYHFRVVSTNASGTSYGPDRTFTTLSTAEAPGGCPNEQVRQESAVNPETGWPFSEQLPDCRGYEMVSPPLKNGSPIVRQTAQIAGSARGSLVDGLGTEGSSVLIGSTGIWPGGDQAPNNLLEETAGADAVNYRVTRGPDGWRYVPVVPSATEFKLAEREETPYPAEIGLGGIWSGIGFSSDEVDLSEADANLYSLDPDGGAMSEIGPSVPASVADLGAYLGLSPLAKVIGASQDLSHVLFTLERRATNPFWPGDGTKPDSDAYSLYEYVGTGHTGEGGDVPSLIDVDNEGKQIGQCGTQLGTRFSGQPSGSGGSRNAVSQDGSTVFFTAMSSSAPGCVGGTGPAANELYARVGELGPGTSVGAAATVNVAAMGSGSPRECASDECGVTSPVTYMGASGDGSKVFFETAQPLLPSDKDSTEDLYECRLPGDSETPLARTGKVNPCPTELVEVSAGSSAAGTPGAENANVKSVVAISEDGSHIYFTASGVLTGADAEGKAPVAGGENLYVWEEPSTADPQGRTAFVATLPSGVAIEEAQATPNGDFLVFTSKGDLTPDDTSTVAQVFLYEAQHEALTRISRSQNGYEHDGEKDGNTTIYPATIATYSIDGHRNEIAEQRSTISNDGSYVVFQSGAALTPQVHGGKNNVYEWHDGNVSLISDGVPEGANTGKEEASGLIGIDASGQNVFFTTAARLVGQDSDDLEDLYDARIDGGFPAPVVSECSDEGCQGPVGGAPLLSTVGSGAFPTEGDIMPAASKAVVKSKTKLKVKVLTRAQKLSRALAACDKDKAKSKRARCEAAARKRYGAKKTKVRARSMLKRGKSTGKGGKS